MILVRRVRHLLLLLAFLLAAPLAHASEASRFVQTKHGELVALVKNAKTKADEKKLEKAFDDVFDYDALARASLRELWGQQSPEQQAEFRETLKQLVRAAYRRSLKKVGDYAVEYQGESQVEGGTLVRTVAKSRRNARAEPVRIDYVVRLVDGRWYAVNIFVEESSLVDTYYRQFRKVIEKEGFAGLLRRMKGKLGQG